MGSVTINSFFAPRFWSGVTLACFHKVGNRQVSMHFCAINVMLVEITPEDFLKVLVQCYLNPLLWKYQEMIKSYKQSFGQCKVSQKLYFLILSN